VEKQERARVARLWGREGSEGECGEKERGEKSVREEKG